ncbi:hypothetical protein SAMN05421741_12511 [Paenimyroides ummariense]|uniref:Uncharacterized protein n=1 Tax=Paenimyroides ummariense TaxID=913024 RepID=A0A1I5F6D0_9FLAO|nr:hypothetical protein [Paenimyroides ummariense]SFO19233.1 hypothetical protein SAMN05421741_12511 [Paenimyroides ummariense]
MAIYISNDAIQNIPIASEDGNKQRGKLSSNLLRSDKYLSALVENPNKVAPLRKGADHESVRTIIIAFKILKITYVQDAPEFTNVNSQSTNFNEAVENNVKLVQTWVGLSPSGIVDVETVLALDQKLFEVVRNLYTKDVIGKNTNVEISYFDKYNEGTNTYTITNVLQENNDVIPTDTEQLPRGQIIIEIDKGAVFPSPSTRSNIEKNNQAIEGKQLYSNFSLPLNTNIAVETKDNPQKITNDLENFIETTPKSEFEDMGETYEVSAGESFADIVLKKYYNTGPESIISPVDGSTIFTFPNRTPFPVANRSEDARFQFYLNFLYYSNTEEIDGNVQSWGMKMANSYSRYNVDELEDYNIYNNNYNPSDANTALPNYYRFLKHMELVRPSAKLNFDGVGNCLNFTPDAGKKIVIPKRQYVDSIYNLLNYRHGEMLEPVAGKMVQVVGSALTGVISTLESALNTLTGVAQIVKTEAIAVYNEAADFFITGLAFLKDFLKEYWPRGSGGKLQLDLEVTWGIPVATNGSTERRLWRKVTQQDEITICFAEKGSLKVGGDVAVGVNAAFFQV